MNTELLLAASSALLAGLAGSGHCFAMCGGMAGLLTARTTRAGKPLRRTLIYNLGRIGSYTLGGLLAGLLGYGIGMAAGLGVAAGQLRIVSGIIIVMAGLYLLTGLRWFAPFERIGERLWQKISPHATRQLRREGHAAEFTLGMLWGWLPCGLTWSMLAIAAASGTAASGGIIMLAFGIGTLPAMLAVGLAGFRLRSLLNNIAVRRSVAVMLIAAGAWTMAFPMFAHSHAAPANPSEIHHH